MEIKNVPFNPNEKGILVLKGMSERSAKEFIEKLRDFIQSKEEKAFWVLLSGANSIEFVRLEDKEIIDIKYESEEKRMKFQISKNKILQATNMVKQAIAIRTTMPILKTVLIKAEDGWVTLRATNTILDIEVKVKAEVEREGSCCVDSLVTELLPTFDDGKYDETGLLTNPVKFSLDKRLSISQGKRRHQPVYMNPEDFPGKQEIKDYVEVSCEDKIKMVEVFQRLQTSTSTLADRPVLQGFHINPHLNFIIASDGNRVSLWEDITVPGNITTPPARIVMPILSNLISLSENDKLEVKFGGWSGFRAEQYLNEEPIMKWEIIFNSLSGDFPTKARDAIKEARETEPKLKVIAPKDFLKNILGICKLYSDRGYESGKGNYQVVLSKNGQGVVFSMNIPDLVEMEEPLECEVQGDDDLEVWFQPTMLLESLSSIKSDKAELRLFSEKAPFLLLDNESPQFSYLQVPMAPTPKNDNIKPTKDLKAETEKQIKTWFPEGEETPALGVEFQEGDNLDSVEGNAELVTEDF